MEDYTSAELITQLYVGYYNRAPDPEGLAYWIEKLESGVPLRDIADSFAVQPETIAAYPFLAMEEPTAGQVAAFLTSVYNNLFGRDPDAEGLAYYSNQLLTGERTASQIISNIQENSYTNTSAQGQIDAQVLANKVQVGLAFSTALGDAEYDAAAALIANSILDNVDETQASVDAALEQLAQQIDGAFTLEAAIAAGDDLPENYTLTNTTLSGVQTLASVTAAAAIVAGAANAEGLELTGDFTVEATAAEVLEAGALPVDAGRITLTDEAITTAQRDALIELGFDPADLPTLDDEGLLSEALADLAAAQEAQADALEAVATAVYEETSPAGTLEDFVDAFTTTAQAETALDTAEAALLTEQADLAAAQSTLATARSTVGTDAAIATALANAQAAARADIGAGEAAELLAAREAARSALQADIGVDGSNVALLTEARDAILAYAAAGGDLSASVGGGDDVTDLLAGINGVLNAASVTEASAATYLATIDTYDFVLGGIPGSEADEALDEIVDELAERGALIDAVDSAQTALAGDGAEGAALVAAETASALRQSQIQAVADAQADLSDAQAYVEELTALVEAVRDADDAITDAQDAFEDLGLEVPVTVDGVTLATGDADIFLFTEGQDGSIISFGDADILFLGSEYTRLDIAGNVNLDGTTGPNITAGSATTLEVFFQQQGANTVLFIEQDAFEGNDVSGGFGGTTITLVGVNAEDLSYNNGFVSFA